MFRKSFSGLLALTAVLTLASCGYTKIGRITADPMRFNNRSVRVEGSVGNSFGAMGVGGYQLEDDSGRIVVVTNQGVPSKGARVEVSGKVMSGVTVMGKTYGTVIQESGHRAY